MKVRATQLGYYGMEMRPEGSIFEIASEDHFSKKWMEPVGKREAAIAEEEQAEQVTQKSKGSRMQDRVKI